MASVVEKLMAEAGGEPAVFLNDIVAQLWPNINVAASKMIKEIADPMFKTMLPGPLASLHFTKIDLGTVPMRISNVLTTKTETNGIKLDMNVIWDGQCDIELDASMIPTLGVEHVKLYGRLSVLLGPLTNIIPLIGAAQVAFINPPVLKLDFTGAANVADLSLIDGSVRSVILGIINSMFTLPNRFLVKLDPSNDYFKTYLEPLGIVRVTIDKAYGFAEETQGKASRFLSKLTRAAPDCYAKVDVGAEVSWQTSTKKNTSHPVWGETHDFVVTDFDQYIKVDIEDEDVGGDDEVGVGSIMIKDILLAGGRTELALAKKDVETQGKVSLGCQFFKFEANNDSFAASDHQGDGQLCGVATILIAGAFGIKGQREELKPSVKVTWGHKHTFQTTIQSDAPGMDISNPAFDQNFRIPITADMVGGRAESFRIALLNGAKEMGAVEVPFVDVAQAAGMTLQHKFDVGGGALVRASICLRGGRAASMQEMTLPQRQKHT